MVASNARRRLPRRSGATPGGAKNGRDMPNLAKTTSMTLRSSAVLASSIAIGTSLRSACGFIPICTRMLIFLSLIHCGRVEVSVVQSLPASPSHFAVLDREIDLGGAGIAVHHLELGIEQAVGEHRQHVAVGTGRAGAEDRLPRGGILQGLHRRAVPGHRHEHGLRDAADPAEFGGVEQRIAAVLLTASGTASRMAGRSARSRARCRRPARGCTCSWRA